MQKNKMIAPSTEPAKNLSQLLQLEQEVRDCADLLHCDIMDGRFVEPVNLTDYQLAQLAKHAVLPLDFHLMCEFVTDESRLDFYISLKPYNITVHPESFKNFDSLQNALNKIKQADIKASLVANLETKLEIFEQFIDKIDFLLIMSVKAGYSGQKFSDQAAEKIVQAKKMLSRTKNKVLLQVDGGINNQNSREIFALGADCLVSGSFIFNSKNKCEAVKNLKS